MHSIVISKRTLDKRLVETRPSGSQRFIWDLETPGFGAWKNQNGRVAFVYQYRSPIDNRVRRITLGKLGELTVDLDDDPQVLNPAAKSENLNRLADDATSNLRSKLREFEDTARRANAAANEANAAEIWTEAFEHFFPMPEDVEEDATAVRSHAGFAKSTALVAYSFDPQIHVRASSKDNDAYVREGTNHLPQVLKNCTIDFRLVNADRLPSGASLRWTVRNNGHDAWNRNDIGHFAGDGVTASESSAYNGKHAMDLTVYQYGRIIGRRRIEVDVRGGTMPARNLPRKRLFNRR